MSARNKQTCGPETSYADIRYEFDEKKNTRSAQTLGSERVDFKPTFPQVGQKCLTDRWFGLDPTYLTRVNLSTACQPQTK